MQPLSSVRSLRGLLGGWRQYARWALSVLLSVAFLWLALRHADVALVGRTLSSIDPVFMAAGTVALIASLFLRSSRWQACFSASDKVSFWAACSAYSLGSLSTMVIPARLGDLVRIYALRRPNETKTKALGTLAVERLGDMVSVVVMVTVLLLAFHLPRWVRVADVTAAVLTVVGLGILQALSRGGERLRRRADAPAPGLISMGLRVMAPMLEGLNAVKSGTRMLAILALSFATWALTVAFYTASLRAVQLQLGWQEGALLTGVLALATVVPAGPGYAGSFELAAMSTLALFAVNNSVAIGYLEFTRIGSAIALLVFAFAGWIGPRVVAKERPDEDGVDAGWLDPPDQASGDVSLLLP